MSIFRSIRNFKRFEHILNTLLKYELGFIIHKLHLKHHLPLHKRLQTKQFEEKNDGPYKIRRVFEELGGAFTKLAQLLSVRPDLIPPDYIIELEKLQDKAKPVPFEDIKEEIEKQLKKPLKEIFPYFKKAPIASASISQVHEAKLKNGQRVAVKVQRPKIRETMEEDISIMFFLANLLEKHIPRLREYSPITIVKEFETWTRQELDFRIEAKHAKRFYYNFKDSRTVKIPKVIDEHTTSKILTLEYIDGTELHDIKKIKKKHCNIKKAIKNGFDAILTQVFVHGFFHADPHPGNILVSKNSTISFVDFGIVGYFDDELKNKAIGVFYGIIENEPDKIIDALTDMGLSTKEGRSRFRMDLEDLIRPLQDNSLSDVKVSYVLEDIFELAHKHKVKLPVDLILFGKTFITLEGLALRYYPDFKMVEQSKPFIKKIKKQSFNQLKEDIINTGWKYKKLIKIIPDKTSGFLNKLEAGSIKVDIEDKDIKNLTSELDKSSNRLTYGMIIASLIIGSALLSYIGKGPMISGLSIFSIAGFFVAILLSIILAISILRENKR
jgi:ubiquinone biosynthesis protein